MQRKRADVSVVIAAAGESKRFGGKTKKVFFLIEGECVVVHSVRNFLPFVPAGAITVVSAKNDMKKMRRILDAAGLKSVSVVEGGRERCDSVLSGVRESKGRIVLIHDGARCFVPKENISAVLRELDKGAFCAAPALTPVETVRIDKKGRIETADRRSVRLMQTPQGCMRMEYLEMLQTAASEGISYTDDVEYFLRARRRVALVEGDRRNIKITEKSDVSVMSGIIRREKCS